MPKLKPIFTLLIFLTLGGTFIAGLQWYSSLPKLPAPGGSIYEGIVGQPHLLNPLFADLNPVDRELCTLIFRGLIKYNSRNQPVGDLAQNWSVKDDGKIYEVQLKQGQYWHDRQTITSDDVVFTYQLTQREEYQGPEKSPFEEVKIEKIDDYQIRFILKDPFAPFLENLTLGILPSHLWEKVPVENLKTHFLNLQPLGSGPAQFKSIRFSNKIENWIDWIEFKLNDGYLEKIRFKFYPSHTDLTTAIKLGEVDTAVLASKKDLDTFVDWPNLAKIMKPIWGRNTLIIFNLRKDKFKSKELRETLAASLYDALSEKDNSATGEQTNLIGTFSPIPQVSWGYTDPTKKLKVKDISLPPEINIETPYDPTYLEIAEFIKKTWNNIGIEVKIDPLEQEGLRNTFEKRDFEILLITQESGHDPDQYIYWHSTQKNSPLLNLSGISHPKIDKALEGGRKKSTLEERKAAYADFQKYFYLTLPAVPLNHPNLYYLASTKIKSLNLRNLWSPSDRFTNINNWYLHVKRPLF